MPVAGVVRDEVEEDFQAEGVGIAQESIEGGEVAEERVDVTVVGDVVAMVGHWGWVEGSEPDPVHPQVAQIVQAGAHPGQVTNTITVRIGKTADVHLIEDSVSPPLVTKRYLDAGFHTGMKPYQGSEWNTRPVPRTFALGPSKNNP